MFGFDTRAFLMIFIVLILINLLTGGFDLMSTLLTLPRTNFGTYFS